MQIKTLLLEKRSNIEVCGWVLTMRSQKDFSFIKLMDGSESTGLQLVIDNNKIKCDNITTGTSLKVKGNMVDSPAKGQQYELHVEELEVLGYAEPELYPLSKGKLPLTYLRSYPHLRCRTVTYSSVFRIKSAISFATHLFFKENNYLHLDPNIMTVNECEGGAGVFLLEERL